MPTQFFLRNTAGPVTTAAVNDRALALTRGGGIQVLNTDTTASGNHLLIDVESSSNAWAIKVKACTISSTVTFNFWGSESSMNNNAQFACVVARYDSAGNFISNVVAQTNANHADGVELGTTAAAMNWTATPTSTTFDEGDILVVIPHVDAIGTMAAASNGVSFNYDGTTAAANADTYVTFTETITPYNRPHAQAQANIKGISRGFGQAQCFISYRALSDGFNNNESNGWGTADSNGSVWENTFSAFSVTNGIANVASSPGMGTANTLDNIRVGKFEGLTKFRTSSMSLSGAAIYFTSHYESSSISNNAVLLLGTTNAYAARWDGGNTQNGTIPTITPNSWYWFRAEIISNGTNQTDFRFKVWADGSNEPSEWGFELAQSGGNFRNFGKVGIGFEQNITTGQTFDLDEVWINTFPGYGQAAALISTSLQLPVTDNFNRSVGTGLGTAPNTDVWVKIGLTDDSVVSVDGSKALIQAKDSNNQVFDLQKTYISSSTGYEVLISGISANTSTPSNQVSFAVVFGMSGIADDSIPPDTLQMAFNLSSSGYFGSMSITSGGGSANTSAVSYIANDQYNLKGQFLKASGGYITQIKIWKVGDTEPGWTDLTSSWFPSVPTIMPISGHPRILVSFVSTGTFIYSVDQIDIKSANITRSGQAQALITSGHFGQGQAQTDVKATYRGHGQSQVDIKAVNYGGAQANTDIKNIATNYSTPYGQTQADIKAIGRGFGQSQADIKAQGYGLGQAQADIKAIGYGLGQTQADIKAQGYGLGQANAAIKHSGSGQAQAAIDHGGHGLTAAAISGDYTIPFDDTFTRTTSNSLGTSDNGDSWILAQGVASNFSTDGSKANIIWPTSAPANIQELKRTLISTPSGIQISTKFSIDKVLGSALQANIFLGLNRTIISPATTDIVAMRITLDTNVDLSVAPVAFNQSGTSAVGSTNYTPNDVYNAKAHILNASNNTLLLKVKIWKDGDAEPGWTRSSVTGHLTPKHPAIEISNISDTNSPITFSLDNFNIIEAWHTESGQAQARIKTTYRQHAQAQADIKQTYFGSGQAQAEIVLSIVTISAVAQAQADIKQTYFGLGQSQADILATYYGLGQAQADIKAAGNGLGQANADIKATGNGLGQAQADIQVTYSQFGQANADILATNFAFGQAQADIKTTYFGLGQSQADILTQGYGLGQANADIKAVNNGLGQAQTDILAVYSQVAQAQADIKQTYYQVAQAQADIKTIYFGSGQSQTDIKAIYWGLANAQADILAVGNGFGQAMATIVGNAYGQAQTDIRATYWGSGQAETWIKATYFGLGQANASIKGAIQQFAQAQTSILTQGYAVGQTQADIKQTYNAFGQSQADILHTYNGSGQAQATIVGNAFGQAQTDIKQTYTQSAQAQADILVTTNQSAQANADIKATSNGLGQANSDIKAVVSQHAQAQADILATQNGSGQANSDIKQTQTGSGQSQADIKSTYFGLGQAQADILATGYGSGQSNADILATNTGHGQAQTDVQRTDSQFAQAQADIQQTYIGSGQANADIKAVGYGSGQAQGDILQTYNQHGQTQADILATQTESGQSQADIKATSTESGQSQASIQVVQSESGQSQANIKAIGYGSGQTQSDIKTQGYGLGQSQGKLNAFDQNASGQAQTNIKFEGTQGFGQAQAKLNAFDVSNHGQSQADIKAVNAGYGQANSDIKAQGYGLGQAQSDIQVITSQNAQANADIKQTNSQFGQAQTDILATQIGSGQAQGDIKAVNNGFGQSQADIKAVNYGSGQAQCSIQTARSSSGQATADIKAIVSSCGQSQASIRATYNSFGQAQASIRVSNTTYGQAQGLITQTGQGYGQANVDIKSVINRFGQANSDILATNNKSGNAQADVKTTVNTSGQTQALIRRAQDAYGQAQATIQSGSRGVGQSQTWVKVTDIIAVAQAQALILKSAGYGQATALIHQPHTLRKVSIGDLSLIDVALGSRAVPNLINSDRVEKVHVGDRSGIGLKVSDQD